MGVDPPPGGDKCFSFETLVIDAGKARLLYVSASRGPHEAPNTLTVYPPPQEEEVRLVGSHD